jgi:hypothetical protein
MGNQLAGCCGLAGWIGAAYPWIRLAGTCKPLSVQLYVTNSTVDEQLSGHIERCGSSVQPGVLVWLLFELRDLLSPWDLLSGSQNIYVRE